MEVTVGPYQLGIATDYGPRITDLRLRDGPSLFATLGARLGLEHEAGLFRFRGGHRLWAAPEIPAVTYAPDDHECLVDSEGGTTRVTAPADRAGVVKVVEVSLEGPDLLVEHRLYAGPGAGLTVAPWAITQLPVGGVAILALPGAATAPLPDRKIVLWPYTRLGDPRIRLTDQAVLVGAEAGPELKLGTGPTPGRIGYLRHGWLFVKSVEGAGEGEVPDFGATHQVFAGADFCELENVGGVEHVSSESAAKLVERWQVFECHDLELAVGLVVGRGP